MKKTSARWIIRIVIWSIVLSTAFTLASTTLLGNAGYILAFGILLIFILVGILFDMVGVAVTAADETPFHSMAAHRGRGGKEAIRLIKSADRVSSFCNDVVGDISGIISGTTTAIVAARLTGDFNLNNLAVQLIISGLVAGLTIGGKAVGKSLAIGGSNSIVLAVARVINLKNRAVDRVTGKSKRR